MVQYYSECFTAILLPTTNYVLFWYTVCTCCFPDVCIDVYEFDIFMSFSQTETVQAEMIFKTLENSHYNYRVVWHHRDFNIGVPSEQNIEDYIYHEVILALSPGFLQSDHCKSELAGCLI